MSKISINRNLKAVAVVTFCAGLLALAVIAYTDSSGGFVPRVQAQGIQAQEANEAQSQESDEREDARRSRCTERNVKGRFGYSFTGSANGVGPVVAVGIIRINGDGTLSATDTQSINGQIIQGRKFTGTYTVNPNCTGSAVFSTGGTGDFVVVDDRQEFLFVFTNPGIVVSGLGKKQ